MNYYKAFCCGKAMILENDESKCIYCGKDVKKYTLVQRGGLWINAEKKLINYGYITNDYMAVGIKITQSGRTKKPEIISIRKNKSDKLVANTKNIIGKNILVKEFFAGNI